MNCSVLAASSYLASPAIAEHFLCPAESCVLHVRGDLHPEPGFFRLGSALTCFGCSTLPAPAPDPLGALTDLLPLVGIEEGQPLLPFDPAETVENLRLERYQFDPFSFRMRLLKRLYYCIRPVTSPTIRQLAQRLHAVRWRQRAFPRWPVDTTVDDLLALLLKLALKTGTRGQIPFIWFWPDGACGCLTMTHDVETRAGHDFCPRLMDLDDEFGLKASFHVVPERRYRVSPGLLQQIRDRGFEVGVQDLNHDGRLFDDREEFLRRAARINHYGKQWGASGYRSGVLYRNPAWYRDLDFSYDFSFPNVAPLDPQPGGCCTVMPFFVGHILELPLTTVQDYTLFTLIGSRSIDLWRQQIDIILSRYGLASFLVHPDYILEPDKQAIYRQLLTMLRQKREERRLWAALPGEIDRWWRARARMKLVSAGDGWHIEGEGSERATLAWAKLVDDQLVYELPSGRLPAEPAANCL